MARRVVLALAAVVALVSSGCMAWSGRSESGQEAESSTTAPPPDSTTTSSTDTTTTTTAVEETTTTPTEAPATTAAPAPTTQPPRPARPPSTPADASAGPAEDGGPARARLGTIIADLGYRPADHGFEFENYGGRLPNGSTPTNLTVDDLRKVFGDDVCQTTANGECQLTPAAGAWLDQANRQMSGGHCFGFSVASLLLWRQALAAAEFGGGSTSDLVIVNNQTLQRRIALDWTAQLLDSVRTKLSGGTPNEVLDTLVQALRPDSTEVYTLAFWKPDGGGGHAVTPFAVEDRGGGEFSVLVYDSNWPNQTRAIKFDRNANSWTYAAAANPKDATQLYTGTPTSNNLVLFPLSPGLGVQPCPFCGTRRVVGTAPTAGAVGSASATSTTAAAPTQEIFLVGSHAEHPDLLITDDGGRRLGFVKGKLVREIPGGRVNFPLANQSWRVKLAPHFVVPANRRYTIRLDGTRLEERRTETLTVIGPAFNVSVPNIPVRPGDRDVMVLGHNGENLTYSTNRARTPDLEVGITEEDASYTFEIRGVAQARGTSLQLGFPIGGGTMSLRNWGATRTSVASMLMTRHNAAGTDLFATHSILLFEDARVVLRYGAWKDESDGIRAEITHDGATTTKVFANEVG